MYADAKHAWTAALRSDRFKQGAGALKNTDGDEVRHCCLGVLCEVAIEAGVEVEVSRIRGRVVFDGESGCLPPSVANWAGLTRSPTVRDGSRHLELVLLNDGTETVSRHSFTEIADLIDTMPEGVRPG